MKGGLGFRGKHDAAWGFRARVRSVICGKANLNDTYRNNVLVMERCDDDELMELTELTRVMLDLSPRIVSSSSSLSDELDSLEWSVRCSEQMSTSLQFHGRGLFAL